MQPWYEGRGEGGYRAQEKEARCVSLGQAALVLNPLTSVLELLKKPTALKRNASLHASFHASLHPCYHP